MKLNPPASSSDLEAARAIARRLHQRAFASKTAVAPDPRPEPTRDSEPPRRQAPPPLPTPAALPPVVRPAPTPEPELRFAAPPPPTGAGERRLWSEAPPRGGDWTEEPASGSPAERGRHGDEQWPEAPPEAQTTGSALDDEAERDVEVDEPALPGGGPASPEGEGIEGDALAELAGETAGRDFDAGGPSFEDDRSAGTGPSFEDAEIEEPSFPPTGGEESSFDDLGGEAPSFAESEVVDPSFGESEVAEPSFGEPGIDEPTFASVDETPDAEIDLEEAPPAAAAYEPQEYDEASFEESVPSPPGESPEDLLAGPTDSPEAWGQEPAEGSGTDAAAEDLVEVAAPSWDDVAEACLAHAGARGSMLVAASGEVLSAQGEWPNPGPEAIASRLVAMMERALRDAPTRSVSAPLAGQHLTAWRVPVAEGLLTAVFIGDAPLKADVRPGIDDEIRGHEGA